MYSSDSFDCFVFRFLERENVRFLDPLIEKEYVLAAVAVISALSCPRRGRQLFILFALWLLSSTAFTWAGEGGLSSAQTIEAPQPEVSTQGADPSTELAHPKQAPQLEVSPQGSGAVIFSPTRPLFSPLIGDPREPSIGMTSYLNEKGFEGSLGGTLEFLRWKSSPDTQWGLGIFAGLWTLGENPDFSSLLVDDWFTGLYISEKTGPFSFRLEFQDQKSNLGDALHNDEEPFYHYNPAHPDSSLYYFTRDNQNLTISLDAFPCLRLYVGGGCKTWWDDFDPSESQIFIFSGLEAYSVSFPFLGVSCRAYGTYHFKYQDQAGGTYDHAAQIGLQWRAYPDERRSLRLALTYYGGHSEFGQFYQDYDHHLGLSLYFDP
jgi:hypothetical protein